MNTIQARKNYFRHKKNINTDTPDVTEIVDLTKTAKPNKKKSVIFIE